MIALVQLLPSVFALALIPALVMLIRAVNRHSISLYAHRASESLEVVRYRCAIQNNEDVALEEEAILTITIRNEGGRFMDKPVVYAGPSQLWLTSTGRVTRLRFRGIPPYDTWVVHCKTNGEARDLHVAVEPSQPPPRMLGAFGPLQLDLGAAQSKASLGGRRRPSFWVALLTLTSALGVYFVPIATQQVVYVPLQELFTPFKPALDLPLMLALASLGFLSWIFLSTEPPQVVQGYWAESRLQDDPADRGRDSVGP